jgi:phospholipid/cholesterol/gamma-HCH transport system substrate-binding protein
MRRARVVVATLVVTLVTGVLGACGGGGMKVTATFDDVGDLQPRHSVQVADVRVGQISSVKLTDDNRAEVTMTVNKSVHIPADSTAILRTTSLLGEKFVEIRPKGDPTKGPFLHAGSHLTSSQEAPELEFVASQLVTVLGAVNANDIGTLAKTGAEAFGGRGSDLRKLIDDLSTISATFASRTGQITQVIDNLDSTAGTLAGGADDLNQLLGNLAQTSTILANNRQRTVDALHQLSRVAAAQNTVLSRHKAEIEHQIRQADDIVAAGAGQTDELTSLVDWLHGFATGTPRTIPGDFTQVYMWLIPAAGGAGAPTCQDPRACS